MNYDVENEIPSVKGIWKCFP